MTPTTETWLPVGGYEGLYEVSDLGRVRSVDRLRPYRGGTRRCRGRVLARHLNVHGRPMVDLYRNGEQRIRTIHSLVLEAFVGPRPPGLFGCHDDDDPTNNTVGNLRWDTSKANSHDAVRNGLHPNARKTCCLRGHKLLGANLRLLPPAAPGNQPRRSCVACTRAGVNVRAARTRGTDLDFTAEANKRYAEIMKE